MIIRRSAGFAIIFLAVLGFLLCLAGAAGVWIGKSRIDDVAAALFGTGDEAFEFLESKLDRANQLLSATRTRASGLPALAELLKEKGAEASAEFESVRQTLDEMHAGLQAAEHWLDSSAAVARGVNRVSQALAASQAASGREAAVNAQRVAEFSADAADAIARLQNMRQELLELREKRAVAREVAARLLTRMTELDGKLANLSARIEAFHAQVSTARASAAALGRSVQWWLTFAAVMLTLVLLWFGASQLAMMQYGWRHARRAAAV